MGAGGTLEGEDIETLDRVFPFVNGLSDRAARYV